MNNKITLRRIALITGATSGIGRATAKQFARNGYDLILTGRRKKRLLDITEKLKTKYSVDIQSLNFDVRNLNAAKKALGSLSEEWLDIDVLVNNAGLASGFDPIYEGDFKDWETMIDTNIKGLLYMTRLITPRMVNRRRGHVINICSTAGHEVYPNGNVYCATKYAVDALTKAMRLDLHKHNIRVSQVSPGHVEETEFAMVRFHGDKKRSKIYEDFQPLKSKDVAKVIFFIACQPKHVNIQDVLMMGTQQASSNHIDRSGREQMKPEEIK
jgi:NADP-dependent 3-hydroxy acid dehydrogenase YdfG